MLTEQFVTSTLSCPGPHNKSTNASSPSLKDAGIQVSTLQPAQRILESFFKKSSTPANCLSVSSTHIFAAQAEKAVVHVYSRDRGSQEATVPFSERIHSLVFAGDEGGVGVLILGTEGGRIILWEVATGRQLSTPPSHLQPITALAVSCAGTHLLSGSDDSNIHVWSLASLLSFSPTTNNEDGSSASNASLLKTLSHHRAAITALRTNDSVSPTTALAVSTSKDSSVIIWNYLTGDPLRTFLLPSIPISLALDPCDRAIYTGFEDGTIQLIDLFSPSDRHHGGSPVIANPIHDASLQSAPATPSPSDLLKAPSQPLGPTLAIALSYEANTLLSSHASGLIIQWDIPSRKFSKQLTPTPLPYPITNLIALPSTGFPTAGQATLKLHQVVKPRYDASLGPTGSSGMVSGAVPGNYSIQAQLTTSLAAETSSSSSKFAEALAHPSLPDSYLVPPFLFSPSTVLTSSTSQAPAQASAASPPSLPLPSAQNATTTPAQASALQSLQTETEELEHKNRVIRAVEKPERKIKASNAETSDAIATVRPKHSAELMQNWKDLMELKVKTLKELMEVQQGMKQDMMRWMREEELIELSGEEKQNENEHGNQSENDSINEDSSAVDDDDDDDDEAAP